MIRADSSATPSVSSLSPAAKEAKDLADKIDEMIARHWTEKGAKPARPADDGEFVRRVYLDLVGRIPRTREFFDALEDRREFWRERWIDRKLLASDDYCNHFAATWRHLLVPPDNNASEQNLGATMEGLLRKKFKDNVRYDQFARELITGSLERNQMSATFLQANQMKPETIAASTSRVFLGVKLECAQCHDHPFARWTRTQFWEFTAFYSGIDPGETDPEKPRRPARPNPESRSIKIAGTDKTVEARFLDGTAPQWQKGVATRQVLADWLVRPDNPFFARAAVNRVWSHFFGFGLVEPVDDLSDQNPASHPELLDELAREFAAHDFDLKYLIRAITFSKTYQLSSVQDDPERQDDPRLFSRMALKGLTAEQLLDSLTAATEALSPGRMPFNRGFGDPSPRVEFLTRFNSHERPVEHHTSILQALTLMNGKVIADATSLEKCKTLRDIHAERLTTSQRVESIYIATLTRKPRPEELERLVRYVEDGGPKKDSKAALADVFWALLNSSEFMFNH